MGGKADLVPKTVQTISIPAFTSLSTRYTLRDVLPRAIAREFQARTRFRIENNPAEADAVLNGAITTVAVSPAVFDPTSGKATTVRVSVVLNINLMERGTGRVLYSHQAWVISEEYGFAVDPHQFFDESAPAFDRLSRDVARDVVTSVVENF